MKNVLGFIEQIYSRLNLKELMWSIAKYRSGLIFWLRNETKTTFLANFFAWLFEFVGKTLKRGGGNGATKNLISPESQQIWGNQRKSAVGWWSHSNLIKTSPQAYMGKANQNFVKFWCEAEQTGPARLSWMLWKKKEENLLQFALRENWSVILPKK